MPSLDQLLSRVVERKGYTVLGADKEALFARKGEDALLAAWKTDAPLTAADAQIFLTALEQVHAAAGILVAPKGADPAAKDLLAANKTVETWAESRLVVEVGEAYVKEALEAPTTPAGPVAFPTAAPAAPAAAPAGPRKFPSLVAQAASAASNASSSGAAYFMPNKKKEAPADMQATIPQGRGGQLGYAWGGATGGGSASNAGIAQIRNGRNPRLKTDQWGNLIDPNKPRAAAAPLVPAMDPDNEIVSKPKPGRRAAPAPAPAPTPMPAMIDSDAEAYEIITSKPKKEPSVSAVRESSPPACSTLKVVVSKDEAVAKTGKAGNPKLALVPHVAFEYDLAMSRPGMAAPVTGSGAVLVNSLTGELRTVDALDFAPAEPGEARKDQEKLTAVDVYDKVKGHVAKAFSKTLNVEREVAGNTVMENLKLTPDPEEMGLQHRGIVYLPVWEVTGSTGVTKVDAFTGNVLSS